MWDKLKVAAAVLVITLLAWHAYMTRRGPIAEDLTQRAERALATAQVNGVGVSLATEGAARYRVAELSGDVSLATQVEAVKLVGAVKGIHKAVWAERRPGVNAPYFWQADYNGVVVNIGGFVPDDASLQALSGAAAQLFPGKRINNTMAVAPGAPGASTEEWLRTARTGLAGLARLKRGEVNLTDVVLTLTGATADRGVYNDLNNSVITGLPANFAGRPAIALEAGAAPVAPVAGRSSAEIRQEVEDCQSDLTRALSGKTIEFDSGSSALKQNPDPLLDEIAGIAATCKDVDIEIAGHTDSAGNADSNQKLSAARASTVRNYLLAKGLPEDQLTATGYGETRPIDPSDTEFARAKNRRIEFTVSAPR